MAAPGQIDQVREISAQARNEVLRVAYNEVPYHSKPFPQATPMQMRMVGRLFGLEPPPVENARVLELGCAGGGNLIPLAFEYPGMQAVGIDLSQVQVDQGRALVRELGLRNCELRVLDIVQAEEQLEGSFDYILCHGVFSWVPPQVQQAILQMAARKLSARGVAYVSYNVYPGWKMREVVRDMMLFHAGPLSDPAKRLQQARAMLQTVQKAHADQSTYGKFLASEVQMLSKVEDSYIFHEFLEPENHPMYFKDFVAMAGTHGLAFLGEAHVTDMSPQRFGAEVTRAVEVVSQGKVLPSEQYLDFFTNRTFRQSMLVHSAQEPAIDRKLTPQRLHGVGLTTELQRQEGDTSANGAVRYTAPTGQALTAGSAVTQHALDRLHAARPAGVLFEALVQEVADRLELREPQARAALPEQLGREMLALLVTGMVQPTASVLPQIKQGQHPQASALAQAQCRLGARWVTNRCHQAVALADFDRALLALLDGKSSPADVCGALEQRLLKGEWTVRQDGQQVTEPQALARLAGQLFERGMKEMHRLHLLA